MKELYQEIEIERIDDPEAPMRSDLNYESLQELISSIAEHGLIEPIVVYPKGDRYEVIAGHRRLKACQLLNHKTIKAIVKDVVDEEAEILRIHENIHREDVDPEDQAKYFKYLIEKYGWSIPKIATLINKSESFVRERLEILTWPDYARDAVKRKLISLSAAKWLMKIENEAVRNDWFNLAVRQGISAAEAENWYRQASMIKYEEGPLPEPQPSFVDVEGDKFYYNPCFICKQPLKVREAVAFPTHKECFEYINSIKYTESQQQQPASERAEGERASNQ